MATYCVFIGGFQAGAVQTDKEMNLASLTIEDVCKQVRPVLLSHFHFLRSLNYGRKLAESLVDHPPKQCFGFAYVSSSCWY